MKPVFHTLALSVMILVGVTSGTNAAQTAKPAPSEPAPVVEDKPAPYDDKLMRLSEILGSIHYLRNLCKGGEENWRLSMQQLIDIETAKEPKRQARLTASFNRGFRTFASVYSTCTPQAISAEEKYRAEGATLTAEIIARYGN